MESLLPFASSPLTRRPDASNTSLAVLPRGLSSQVDPTFFKTLKSPGGLMYTLSPMPRYTPAVPDDPTSTRSPPATTNFRTPLGHHPEPYGVVRRSTSTTSTESVEIFVVAPDVTRASMVSHLRVGALNVDPEKSPWRTARQRRMLEFQLVQAGVATTSESSFVAPSERI